MYLTTSCKKFTGANLHFMIKTLISSLLIELCMSFSALWKTYLFMFYVLPQWFYSSITFCLKLCVDVKFLVFVTWVILSIACYKHFTIDFMRGWLTQLHHFWFLVPIQFSLIMQSVGSVLYVLHGNAHVPKSLLNSNSVLTPIFISCHVSE